jgi:hypothetical protein
MVKSETTNGSETMPQEHTPGPWTGYRTGILHRSTWVVSNDPDDDGYIMSEANARLIAAAPGYFEATEELIACLNADDGEAWVNLPAWLADRIEELEQHHKRARGES